MALLTYLRHRWILSLIFGAGQFLMSCSPESSGELTPEENQTWGPTPNILWLVAEDLSPYLPSFGDSTVRTANLDRLAAQGVVYTNVYSPSGVCAPSRFAIATGIYPNRGGGHHMRTGPWYRYWTDEELHTAHTSRPPDLPIYEAMPPPGVRMHSEHLRQAGYYCTNNAKEDYQFRRTATAWDQSGPQAHWRNRAPGQPFFAIFNFGVTHESQIWSKAEDSLWVDRELPVTVPPYLPDNKVGRQDVRRMYSNIVEMDHQVGEVLKQLEADGELENTIIFWYSDHGGPLPRQKRLLYDSGIRLPLIIRFPGQWQAGTSDPQLISFLDFKPTLMSLAGIPVPDDLDGRPFLGSQSRDVPRQYVHAAADRFDERYDMIRAVRDGRFKYIKNFQPEKGSYLPVSYREQMPVMQELLRLLAIDSLNEDQKLWFRKQKPAEELYDCHNDPHELNNLALDADYQEKLMELRQECNRWMEQIGDLGLVDEKEMIAGWWPLGTQPITGEPQALIKNQSIEIFCSTPGASIGYQLLKDQDSLSNRWQVYHQPVPLPDQGRIAIIAHRIGYKSSQTKIIEL